MVTSGNLAMVAMSAALNSPSAFEASRALWNETGSVAQLWRGGTQLSHRRGGSDALDSDAAASSSRRTGGDKGGGRMAGKSTAQQNPALTYRFFRT
jgi:hypothetical protein